MKKSRRYYAGTILALMVALMTTASYSEAGEAPALLHIELEADRAPAMANENLEEIFLKEELDGVQMDTMDIPNTVYQMHIYPST